MKRIASRNRNRRAESTSVLPLTLRVSTVYLMREARALAALRAGKRGKFQTYNQFLRDAALRQCRRERAKLQREGMSAAEIEAAMVAAGVRSTGEGLSQAEKRAALPDDPSPVPRVD